jgi:methyl-accepting chemotaxis protein
VRIGRRITALLSALIVVGLAVLAGVIVAGAYRAMRTLTLDGASATAREKAAVMNDSLDSYMAECRALANTVGRLDEIPVANRRSFIDTMLKGETLANPKMVGYWADLGPDALGDDDSAHTNHYSNDPTGRYVSVFSVSGGSLVETALSNYDTSGWYTEPKRTGREYVSPPYNYTIKGVSHLTTTLAVPIKQKGTVIGTIGVGIDLSVIQNILNTIQLTKGGMAAVLSNNGTVVADSDSAFIGKPLADDNGLWGGKLPQVLDAVKQGTSSMFPTKDYLFFTEPFHVGNAAEAWSVLIGIPVKAVMEPLYDLIRIAIIVSIIILLVMVAAALFISRSISRPVEKAVSQLKSVFTENGACDLTKTVDERSKDEIGELGHYINQTMSMIRQVVDSVKNQAVDLSDVGDNLSNDMTDTAGAVNEITATIQSLKDKVVNQSAGVTETGATMEEVTKNIEKLNEIVAKQTEQVSQSSAAVEEMIANIKSVATTLDKNSEGVKSLSEAAGVGRSSLLTVTEDIKGIAKESEGLLEINAVMENIASQTNLLSMNAAIEAAHAGEAGKGFAVVADEIRKLAENSSEQSSTISSVLKRIKESIDKISAGTGNVLAKFDIIEGHVKNVTEQTDDIRHAMDEQNEGSQLVLEAVGALNRLTQDVKQGSDAMLESSQQVVQESQNLEAVTAEITNGMNEMAIGAEQINKSTNQVNELSDKNKDSINVVVGEIAKFKVA